MDESQRTWTPQPVDCEEPLDPQTAESVEKASVEYQGHWNRLISTTNWEKGQIILNWRSALIAAGAPNSAYSDEAWGQRVGNVTGQHVGRLRRVYEKFGQSYEQYPGLYWSHFQAALDWDDAEMWLEGASQNGWSVSIMRQQRWEAIGAPPEQKPREEDVVLAELDEDVSEADDSQTGAVSPSVGEVQDVSGAEADDEAVDESADDEPPEEPSALAAAAEPARPFEDLPPLPEDLAELVESLKLAIVQQRLEGWQEVPAESVLAALDALRTLVLQPVEA
jgi:hypothetical protein